MKIAMFTNNYKPYIGGVPISIEHLAAGLRQRGHQVYIFAPTYREQEEEEFVVRYPSFPVSIAKAPAPNVFTNLFEKKVQELGIELIHVHHPALVGNVALYLKKKYGIPVIYTYHTRYEQYLHYIKPLEFLEKHTGMLEKYLDFFCKKCDMLIAPTPSIQQYLLKRNLSTRICVMPTGIPAECFKADEEKAARLRSTYKKDTDFLLCTVSRLAKEKNLLFQLEGIVHLKRKLELQGKTFRHMLIGDGPQRKELELRAKQLGILENLIFMGNVPNKEIRNYQAAADLFLFTSKSETQGIVLLEAMAVGKPVVALEGTGVHDVVEYGKNGFVCEEYAESQTENADSWAEHIVTVLEQPKLYDKMSRAARATAERYREETIAEQAEAYYKEISGSASQWPEIYDILST